MIPKYREWYNAHFSNERYTQMLEYISELYNDRPLFRIAETPFFVPALLKDRLIEACNEIQETILRSDFKELSQEALYSPEIIVPNEDEHTTFLQMDFGICKDKYGDPMPQLIEVQGFPSVYFFQLALSEAFRKFFNIPKELKANFNGMTSEEYVELLRDIIIADENPENVVLLEIEPDKQNTRIDFYGTAYHLGLKVLCLSKVIKRARKLYYLAEDGREVEIRRIYNRVIFDELHNRPDFTPGFDLTEEIDAKWVGHPNWFNRISKYILPLLKSKYVPECLYLDKLEKYPDDLENFVLKPLYSFSGRGVELHITKEMLDAIKDKNNYILQKKVNYERVIRTPNEPVKVEIRMLMLWKDGDPKPQIVNNLARLSKGEMIGVRYNKDKDWVGGSVAFFE